MTNIEQVQKHLVSFCKLLPSHVEKWRSLLEESDKPLKALGNFADQLRHIEKANIKHMENFDDVQNKLQYNILTSIEEEMNAIKGHIDNLNKINHDFKNKLTLFERSTIDLDWERNSMLIHGNATQPSLSRLLQSALEFSTFFSGSLQKINDTYKTLDVRNEQSVQSLEKSFVIDLSDSRVTYLLSITQYVDNEKAII